MNGKLNINARNGAIEVDVDLQEVDAIDKLFLLNSVCESVHLSEEEFQLFVVAYHTGALKECSTRVSVDTRIGRMLSKMREEREENESRCE